MASAEMKADILKMVLETGPALAGKCEYEAALKINKNAGKPPRRGLKLSLYWLPMRAMVSQERF